MPYTPRFNSPLLSSPGLSRYLPGGLGSRVATSHAFTDPSRFPDAIVLPSWLNAMLNTAVPTSIGLVACFRVLVSHSTMRRSGPPEARSAASVGLKASAREGDPRGRDV